MPQLERTPPLVLVVDDEALVLELVTTRLTLAGYRTCIARNGFDALEQLSTMRPDAMLLDINMPGLDGFGVMQDMQNTGMIRCVPTLVLTARNQPEDVNRALALGARDYLAKPFKDSQLRARVARLVRKVEPLSSSIRVDQEQVPGSGTSGSSKPATATS